MEYNPYKMKTSICIDGSDVKGNSNYRSIDDFIGRGTPLQTWVEPIDYLNWPGLLNEIADPENNGEIEFCFSGRKIDFEDLKRSLEDQNKNREEGTRLSLRFRQEDPQLDDKKLSENIEDIVKELQSDRFHELIEERSRSQTLQKKYEALETNYAKAKEREFDVVFAGVYSSGKSTLLNTLIRHNILPTSDSTCTSKNCRIKHDGSLGNKVSLLGLDEDQKVVLPKSVFDSDEACASKFMEVCPTGKVNPQYEKVTTIEIGADLSHLYPKSVSEKNFTLVLVDTPGMDSAQSIDEHGVNQHARLAQLAITHDNSKPMVVLCADAQKYEDKSIGEFMGDIIQQSVDERGGFNDRFLFLMNKCDSLTYGNGERIEDRKAAFAQYLRDSGKCGIASEEDEKRIQEAAHFVPRIFPVTAIVASAIQRGADKYSGEELTKEPVKRTLCNRLEEFQKNVCRYTDSNYYLSQFCDIPAYRRVEMDTAFRKALKAGDIITATQLQCGLMSVECAIRDYIARYAYPIKVRDLLETFEDILTDVCSFKDSTVADIQRRIDKLGENDGARKEAEERKRLAAERSAKLEEAKKLIDAQLDKLDEIEFDATALGKAREQFEASIDADPIIHELRHKQKISTGKKSADDVKQEIKQKSAHIQSVFTQAGKGTLSTLETLKRDYDQKLEEIFTIIDKSTKRIGTVGINPSDFPFNFYLFICCPDDRYQCVHHLPLVLKADILPVIQIPGNAFHLLHRHSVRREFCNLIGNGLPPCVQLLNFAVGIGEQNRACARQRVKQLFNLAFYLCQFQPLCSQFRGDFCSLVPTCQRLKIFQLFNHRPIDYRFQFVQLHAPAAGTRLAVRMDGAAQVKNTVGVRRHERIAAFPAFDFSRHPCVPGFPCGLVSVAGKQLLPAFQPQLRWDKPLMWSQYQRLSLQVLVLVLCIPLALIVIAAVCPGKVGGIIVNIRSLAFVKLVYVEVSHDINRVSENNAQSSP